MLLDSMLCTDMMGKLFRSISFLGKYCPHYQCLDTPRLIKNCNLYFLSTRPCWQLFITHTQKVILEFNSCQWCSKNKVFETRQGYNCRCYLPTCFAYIQGNFLRRFSTYKLSSHWNSQYFAYQGINQRRLVNIESLNIVHLQYAKYHTNPGDIRMNKDCLNTQGVYSQMEETYRQVIIIQCDKYFDKVNNMHCGTQNCGVSKKNNGMG